MNLSLNLGILTLINYYPLIKHEIFTSFNEGYEAFFKKVAQAFYKV